MKKWKLFFVLFFALVNAMHCVPAAAIIFIPLLGAQWTNKADAANTFFFFGYTDNVNSSNFDGNENNPSGGQDNFTGSFNNHDITFTYTSTTATVSKRGKTYSGTINDASTVMNLSSSSLGNLTLEKR